MYRTTCIADCSRRFVRRSKERRAESLRPVPSRRFPIFSTARPPCRFLCRQRIGYVGFREAFCPEDAGVATTAGPVIRSRIVATVSQSKVYAKFYRLPDDIRLRHGLQWRLDPQDSRSVNSCLSGQVRHLLEGSDKLRTTIRIPRIVDGIHSDKNVGGACHLGVRQSQRKEDGIPCGNIRHGDASGHVLVCPALGNIDGAGQRRSAKNAQIDLYCFVFQGSESLGNGTRSLQLLPVPLPVVKGKTVAVEALLLGNCEAGGGIKTTTQKTDGSLLFRLVQP